MSVKPLSPSRQVIFHQMLVAARKTTLMDALSEALGEVDPNLLKKQISRYVPAGAQKRLAASGIRDEHVFPAPAILEQKPTLVGYYRLMLGISQKRFYRKGTRMGLQPICRFSRDSIELKCAASTGGDGCASEVAG